MQTVGAVVEKLIDEGVVVMDQTIFVGSDAQLPENFAAGFMTLTETRGKDPVFAHNASPIRRPQIQVQARGTYAQASALITGAWIALGGDAPIVNTTLNGIFILCMYPMQDPFQLPDDAKGRVRLAFNLNITRR